MNLTETLNYFSLFTLSLTRRELQHTGVVLSEQTPPNVFRCQHLFAIAQTDIRERHRHTVHTDRRMHTAKRAARIIRHVPFVRAIFLCNTVAMGAASTSSDVDLFIVTEKGRLWFTRLMVTVVTAISGIRRSKSHVANKICLSFYVSSDGLDFSGINIENDIYLAYWLHTLRPLYDPNDIQRSLYAENQWAKHMIPNGLSVHKASPRIAALQSGERTKRCLEALWSAVGNQLEAQAKAIQQAKMKRNTMSIQDEANTNVVTSDTMLKFHENDRREYYRDKWQELCDSYAS